ncbi:MAG: alanine racemase [Bacillota bacterium]|nr:alanine racemase [Clostridia bacterium]
MHNFVRWIEIDLDAITYNFSQIRQLVPEQVKILSVVKADAYGHGGVEISKALEEAGTDMFAVTTVEEGVELVNHGIRQPILVFAPMLPDQAETILEKGLVPTIDNVESLDALADFSKKMGKEARFHLKVETGMGRTGILPEEISSFMERLMEYPQVFMEGIYSHLATAMMKDKSYSQKQLNLFLHILKEIKKEKNVPLAHIANSAAVLDMPEAYLNMVRVGTLLYGQYPSSHVARRIDLKDPWQAKGRIISVKKLTPGQSVGYGRDYMVRKPMEVGVVPIGYADGFGVLPHTRPAKVYDLVKSTAKIFSHLAGAVLANYMICEEKRLPVVGRIGMQMSMIDITGHKIKAGTEVKIPLRRTTSGARIPRIFLKNGKISHIRTLP